MNKFFFACLAMKLMAPNSSKILRMGQFWGRTVRICTISLLFSEELNFSFSCLIIVDSASSSGLRQSSTPTARFMLALSLPSSLLMFLRPYCGWYLSRHLNHFGYMQQSMSSLYLQIQRIQEHQPRTGADPGI